MKRKIVLPVAAVASVAVLLFVVIVVPTLGQTGGTSSTTQMVTSGFGGSVAVSLPSGNITRPNDLVIFVTRSDTVPAVDIMEISVWVPNSNMYLPVAIINDNTNQTVVNWVKAVVNGTPVWNPPVTQNVFVVSNTTLEISNVEDTIVANLTMPINITLPPAIGANFTLPPMTLMFHPIGTPFNAEKSVTVATTNWTISTNATVVPAWVQVNIPQWLGPFDYKNVGQINVKITSTYTLQK